MNRAVTPPIRIGSMTIGDKTADIMPFETAGFSFDQINEHLARNPADCGHIVPDAMVSSCSECCMETINGRPNIIGRLFRESRKGQGCRNCPVSLASEKLPARDADGNYIRDRSGRILSEADVIRMAEDGEA